MPDSLGFTLSSSTISPFFTCYDKRPYQDELTIEQTVRCLEAELGQPTVLMATDFSNPSHVHGCTDDSVLTGVSNSDVLALAWLWVALASRNPKPGQDCWLGLGLAWLWPEPWLLAVGTHFA